MSSMLPYVQPEFTSSYRRRLNLGRLQFGRILLPSNFFKSYVLSTRVHGVIFHLTGLLMLTVWRILLLPNFFKLSLLSARIYCVMSLATKLMVTLWEDTSAVEFLEAYRNFGQSMWRHVPDDWILEGYTWGILLLLSFFKRLVLSTRLHGVMSLPIGFMNDKLCGRLLLSVFCKRSIISFRVHGVISQKTGILKVTLWEGTTAV
jgi:hypothetical protein